MKFNCNTYPIRNFKFVKRQEIVILIQIHKHFLTFKRKVIKHRKIYYECYIIGKGKKKKQIVKLKIRS